MKKARISAILFDKDGTLVDFEATWLPIITRVLAEMRQVMGLPRNVVEEIARTSGYTPQGFGKESILQSGTTSGIIASWEARLLNQGYSLPEGCLASIFERASTCPEARTQLVAGVPALIARLLSRGFRLGVATSDTRTSTVHGLREAGILDSFDFIAADGDSLPAKPNPRAAQEFRRRFGLPETSLAIIGDSYGDMVFARRSKARFIGMETSCNESGRFVAAGFPVVRDFSDLDAMEALLA